MYNYKSCFSILINNTGYTELIKKICELRAALDKFLWANETHEI